jgi:two-component system, chemotaxis family, protein-glutamate methylesterase/glutaminase
MYKAVTIGGSAGSFQEIIKILGEIPVGFPMPVFLCLHRLKHIRSGFVEALSLKSKLPVLEPQSKETFYPGRIYLAPANYHMYVDLGNKIHLSVEEPVHHSRPSIDLAFISAAYTFRDQLIGILLSGANKDGAFGIKKIAEYGGTTIVQDPKTADVPVMIQAAMQLTKVSHVFSVPEIIDFLKNQK